MALAKNLRAAGARAGLSVKPGTPLEPHLETLRHYDTLLVMSVEPGFGGQEFIPEVLDKVRTARRLVDTGHLHAAGRDRRRDQRRHHRGRRRGRASTASWPARRSTAPTTRPAPSRLLRDRVRAATPAPVDRVTRRRPAPGPANPGRGFMNA